MQYTFEKNKLKSYLGDYLYSELKLNKAVIAGGMITSLFTNREINDIDIYFKSEKDIYNFAKNSVGVVVSHTKKATQWFDYNDNSKLIQIIHYKTFSNVDEIFKNFDFTVCMGAFDFESEEFVLHEDFLKHNSQRILKFNELTEFPIISALRVDKYKNKGYTISKADYIKILLTVMNLKVNSYDELKEHLGGMYGESYDKLFENADDENFDIMDALTMISNLVTQDSYFKESNTDYDVDEILEYLDKSPRNLTKIKNNYYRILETDLVKYQGTKIDRIFSIKEVMRNLKLYKFVKKESDGTYSSFYDNSFKYTIGELAIAKSNGSFRSGVIYLNSEANIHKSTYHSSKDAVLIEVSVRGDDIKDWKDDAVTVSKCEVIREVPLEEFTKFENKKI